MYRPIGEDEKNWDTISFDPTLCFIVMPFISLYLYLSCSLVREYYYII